MRRPRKWVSVMQQVNLTSDRRAMPLRRREARLVGGARRPRGRRRVETVDGSPGMRNQRRGSANMVTGPHQLSRRWPRHNGSTWRRLSTAGPHRGHLLSEHHAFVERHLSKKIPHTASTFQRPPTAPTNPARQRRRFVGAEHAFPPDSAICVGCALALADGLLA